MESKYFCKICNTKPDQLSHHKAHLETNKHCINREHFINDIKVFSLTCCDGVKPDKWEESKYKADILSKYLEIHKTDKFNSAAVTEWYKFKYRFSFEEELNADLMQWHSLVECYENEHNCKLDMNTLHTNLDFKNYRINKIIQSKETVKYNNNNTQQTTKLVSDQRQTTELVSGQPQTTELVSGQRQTRRPAESCGLSLRKNRNTLSRYTNVKFQKIENIRKGLVDLRFLFTPPHLLSFEECDTEISNDQALRYSCLLFHSFGIHFLHPLFQGLCGPIDIEEHPEEKKANSFYFYKEVVVEHTVHVANVANYEEDNEGLGFRTKIRKHIWVSCYMGDFLDCLNSLDKHVSEMQDHPALPYSHIKNNDFKYFIKESLIDFFTAKTNEIEHRILEEEKRKPNEEFFDGLSVLPERMDEYLTFRSEKALNIEKLQQTLRYYTHEIVLIRELSLSSETLVAVEQICKYLFEYDENLIEHYKTNAYIAHK